MQKTISISLAILYLTLSNGVGFGLHYCMGQLNSVVLWDAACCCGDMAGHYPCCETETYFFQLDQDQIQTTTVLRLFESANWSMMIVERILPWKDIMVDKRPPMLRPPPDLMPPPLPLFEQYEQRLFYG